MVPIAVPTGPRFKWLNPNRICIDLDPDAEEAEETTIIEDETDKEAPQVEQVDSDTPTELEVESDSDPRPCSPVPNFSPDGKGSPVSRYGYDIFGCH